MTTRILIAALCFSFAAWVSPVNAAPVTFNFLGTVDSVDAPLAGTFNTTQFLSGSFTFDSDSADSNSNPGEGLYDVVVPNSLSLSVGSYSAGQVGPTLSGFSVIFIRNGIPDEYVGDWYRSVSGASVGTYFLSEFYIDLVDSSQAVFSSDALPLLPPSLAAFDTRNWGLVFLGSDEQRVRGTLTSLEVAATPEPTTVLLWGTTALGLGLARWRRRRQS